MSKLWTTEQVLAHRYIPPTTDEVRRRMRELRGMEVMKLASK